MCVRAGAGTRHKRGKIVKDTDNIKSAENTDPVADTSKEQEEADVKKRVTAHNAMRTLLEKGVDYRVPVGKTNLLHRLHIFPSTKRFMVYPIHLGALYDISEIILLMEGINAGDDENLFATGIKTIVSDKDRIVEIIAIAILNREIAGAWARFRKWNLIRYLNANLNSNDIVQLTQLVIAQMGVTDFLACFISIKKLGQIEMAKGRANSSTPGKS